MGLDWMVADKAIPEKVRELEDLQEPYRVAKEALDQNWKQYLKEGGHENPRVYPNSTHKAWMETESAWGCQKNLDGIRHKMARCVVTAMETLGVPQVGFDEKATTYCADMWEENHQGEGEISLEDFLRRSHGMFVPQLMESDGLPGIGGYFAGSESFRGKCLRYVPWLDEKLQSQAYEEHSPEELVEYGNRLRSAVETAKRLGSRGGEAETEAEEIEIVEKAFRWCVFWGEQGHGMSPWY